MKAARLFLLSALFLCSCVPTAKEICHDRLPELQRSVSNAITVLKDWNDDNAGRSLASLGEPGEKPTYKGLSDGDRKSWQRWAEQHLVETQSYIDLVPADPRFRGARDSLTQMANAFVSFHGYVGDSRTGPMIRALETIEKQTERISADVCTGIH